jgi:hypothetical protein
VNRTLTLGLVAFLALEGPAFAHALDEYVQATLISVETDRVEASMRLVPGVAVFAEVFEAIDTNGDRVLSEVERRRYAERVLSELSLSIDGTALKPQLVSVDFPAISELKDGVGEIRIELMAPLPPGGPERKLVFENHHQARISAYLVNCAVPRDSRLHVVAQERSRDQAKYRLDYRRTAVDAGLGPRKLGKSR